MDILTVARTSKATVLDSTGQLISDVAANLPRLETVATCGVVVVTARAEGGAAYTPFAADLTRDVLLVGKWVAGGLAQLYARSAIDAQGTLLLDVRATVGQPGYSADVAAFYAADGLQKYLGDCRVMADGSYIVSLSRGAGYDGAKYLMAIFRSTDAGATWTRVLRTVSGGAPGPQSIAVSGARAVCGSYCDPVQAKTSVWLSEDNGATWTEIWTQTAIPEHVHFVIFDPVLTTRLWFTLGETTFTKLARLDYAGGVWTYSDVINAGADHDTVFGASLPLALGGEILLGASHDLAYDPATGLIRHWLVIPSPIEGANTPYGYWTDRYPLVPVCPILLGGILYAPMTTFGTYAANWDAGLLVSPDNGKHWARVYWTPTTKGVTRLVAWRGLIFAGTLSQGTVDGMISFPPPQVALTTALRLEGAVTNAMTGGTGGAAIDGSTFTHAGGGKSTKNQSGWTREGGAAASFVDASILGDGVTPAGCYGMFAAELTIHPTLNEYDYGGVKCSAITAAEGDRVTFSCWVKAMNPWPANRKMMAAFVAVAPGVIATSEISGISAYSAAVRPSADEWMELRIEGKCTTAGTFYVVIYSAFASGSQAGESITCTFDLDADTVTPSTGTWANGSRVSFKAQAAIPAELTRGVTYYAVNSTGTTFQVSTTLGGAAINLVNAGTGTAYVYGVDPWTFRWTAAMVVLDANNWYAGSFQPGGTARTAEYADATLTGLPTIGWSIGLDWRPGSGNPEYSTDLGILSVGDGTHWMDLAWDASEAKFLLTDDGGQSGTQVAAMKWRHFDNLRLVLTSDGTDTWLYVIDPANGIQAALKCTAVNIGKPSTLRIGANHDASLGAAGRFFNVWKEARKWSATEVANEAPYPGATVADGVYDYTPRGAAELLGVGR